MNIPREIDININVRIIHPLRIIVKLQSDSDASKVDKLTGEMADSTDELQAAVKANTPAPQ